MNGNNLTADIDTCLISGNVSTHSTFGGGGIAVFDYFENATVRMLNTTIVGNSAPTYGGGIHAYSGSAWFDIAYCIIWGNCAPYGEDAYFWGPPPEIYWSDVDTTKWVGTDWLWECINADPLFCDPVDCSEAPTTFGDYHLDAASPCLPAQTGGRIYGIYGQGCDIYTSVAGGGGSLLGARPGIVAYPNPFGGEVTLRCSLPGAAAEPIVIYDLRGRLVRTVGIADRSGALVWNGTDDRGRGVPAGTYFVRSGTGEKSAVRKITIVR